MSGFNRPEDVEGFTAHEDEAEVEGHGFTAPEGFLGADGFQATSDDEAEVEGHGFTAPEGFLGADGFQATSDDDDVEAHLFEQPEGFQNSK